MTGDEILALIIFGIPGWIIAGWLGWKARYYWMTKSDPPFPRPKEAK